MRPSFLTFVVAFPLLAWSASDAPEEALDVFQHDGLTEEGELGVYEHEGLVEDEEEEESYPAFRFGIGVGLSSKPFTLVGSDSTVGTPASFTNISLPLYLDRFRLEPEFGFYRQVGGATSFSLEALAFDLGGEAFDVRTSSARFLIGAQYVVPLGRDTNAFFGPKIGLQRRTMHFSAKEVEGVKVDLRAVDFWVGGTAGGEAFLTEHFSLGVEGGLFYLSLGKTAFVQDSVNIQRGTDSDRSWVLTTYGSLVGRLYFL